MHSLLSEMGRHRKAIPPLQAKNATGLTFSTFKLPVRFSGPCGFSSKYPYAAEEQGCHSSCSLENAFLWPQRLEMSSCASRATLHTSSTDMLCILITAWRRNESERVRLVHFSSRAFHGEVISSWGLHVEIFSGFVIIIHERNKGLCTFWIRLFICVCLFVCVRAHASLYSF